MVVGYLFLLKVGQKCFKMRQNVAKICRSIDIPGGSELTRAPGRPQNGDKKTRIDMLEFRDIKGPDPYNEIWFN